MKLEDLLDAPPAKLKAMTDAELLEFFKPALEVTRPELVVRKRQAETMSLYSPEQINAFKLKVQRLRAAGVDMSKEEEAALMKKMFPRK